LRGIHLRNRAVFLSLILASFAGACGSDKKPDISNSWPATAAVAARTLSEWNFDCLAEGRELYPSRYSCSHMDEKRPGSVYLYADDQNELVGIRVFAPSPESILFKIGFTLSFGNKWRNVVGQDWKKASTRMELGTILLESGQDSSSFFVRLTPISRIESRSSP
jgi:hypothetical protein